LRKKLHSLYNEHYSDTGICKQFEKFRAHLAQARGNWCDLFGNGGATRGNLVFQALRLPVQVAFLVNGGNTGIPSN
jgi:hypothetical protein